MPLLLREYSEIATAKANTTRKTRKIVELMTLASPFRSAGKRRETDVARRDAERGAAVPCRVVARHRSPLLHMRVHISGVIER
jgi:hypothetical protein